MSPLYNPPASGGSGAPTTADYVTGSAQAGLSAELVLGTGVILPPDLAANRPAASLAGRLFYATDTGVLSRDNGSSWDMIASGTAGANLVKNDQANTYTTGAQSFAAATSLLVPASGGAAPTADGSLAYDTTQDAWAAGGAGTLNGKLPRVLAMLLGNGGATDLDDAASGADGTTEKSFATKFTLPANYLQANKGLLVIVHLEFTTSGTAPSVTLRLKLGATNVYASTTTAAQNSMTTRGIMFGFLIQGTAAPGAAVNVETVAWASITGPWGSTTAGLNSLAQPVAVATNASKDIVMSSQWNAATTGNTARLRQLAVLELN